MVLMVFMVLMVLMGHGGGWSLPAMAWQGSSRDRLGSTSAELCQHWIGC